MEKPTLGIKPDYIWEEEYDKGKRDTVDEYDLEELPKRIIALGDCIIRHIEQKGEIKPRWMKEYNILLAKAKRIGW